ncbi:MAG: Tad domain-containing protein, partial [Planctomycetes bacterium]|nr:Tad domain-containing protein [Planctomycetota bacterium]
MTPETIGNAKPDFQRRPTGLLRGEEGQITVIFALLSMALVFFWMSVYQTGEVVSDRIKIQDTADACAYSGAVWGARMLNLICYTNRAIIANIVSMTELVIARSHSKFWLDVAVIIELISTALSWIPILGQILNAVASVLTGIAMAYDLLTYALFNIAVRSPTQFLQGPKLELWFIFLHNLCALENSVHWMLAPPPVNGVYVDTGAISSKLDLAVVPIAIKKTNEMIDPMPGQPGASPNATEEGRIWVNPSMSVGAIPFQARVMSQIFRQWTLQSYHDLLAWPGGRHGVQRGDRKGEYKHTEKRVFGTKSAYNKTIDQKWRLKWLIEETGKRRLTGLWAWNRGAEGEGMSVLSQITNLWFVGNDIGGTTNVDELKTGAIQIINFMGGKIFVRAAAPERMQNDKDIEATDYLRVWYRQFWKLFSFPKKTLFQAGEIALESEESFPAFCTIPSSCAISSVRCNVYNNLKNNDKYRKTGYRGLPHEDNANHKLDIFVKQSPLPIPNPLDHFPTIGFDPPPPSDEKTKWRPTGIHELNNDVFQQNQQNRGERAIWKSSGNPGFRGKAWFASRLPTYCYVLDAKKKPTGGGGGG